MNTRDLQAFNEAVAAAQSGQTQAAHLELSNLHLNYPSDTGVLLWLAFTAGGWETSNYYLEQVARLEPNNPSLPGAQDWLASQKPVPPQSQSIPDPVFEPVGAAVSNSAYSASSSYQTPSATSSWSTTTLPSQVYGDTTETSSGHANGTGEDDAEYLPKKSKKPGPIMIAGGISLVAIIITIVLLLTGALNGPAFNGVGDIPAPPNGQQIPLTLDNSQFNQFALLVGNRQEGEYRVPNGKFNEVVSFYRKQMVDNGWSTYPFLIGSSDGSLQMYMQGDAYAGIIISTPLTASEAKYRATSLPGSQLQAGDVDVLLLQEGDSN